MKVSSGIIFLTVAASFFKSCKAMPPFYSCKVLDLTQTLHVGVGAVPQMSAVKNPPGLDMKVEVKGSIPGVFDWVEVNSFCAPEHIGTHIDAPAHFAKGHLRVDRVPLEQLIGEACVIHIAEKAAKNPSYAVSVEDLENWEKENGRFDDNCLVLMDSGYGKYWNDVEKFQGSKNSYPLDVLKFPGFSGQSAEWLVKNRNIKAIGTDTLSLDAAPNGVNTMFSAHVALLNADVVGFENLANLDKLPARGATVAVLPAKFFEATGAPIRAIAVGWNGKDDPCTIGKDSEQSPFRFYLGFGVLIAVVLYFRS